MQIDMSLRHAVGSMQGCALPVANAKYSTVAEVKEDDDAESDDACTVFYWHSEKKKVHCSTVANACCPADNSQELAPMASAHVVPTAPLLPWNAAEPQE